MPLPQLSRRSLLGGFAVAALGGVAGYLVAQGSDAADAKQPATAANGYGPPAGRPGGPANGQQLVAEDAVPAGGGVVVDGVVVTRTDSGAVQAFSATCTHQGCTVSSVAQGRIVCPCHGSSFDAATGAVLSGPATRPLPAVDVTLRRGFVVRP